MAKITPFLWFDSNLEEAIDFYRSVFPNTRVAEVTRYGDAGPGPKGTVMTAKLTIEGQDFIGLNGGPQYQFTEAISFMILCDDQKEVDHYWERLSGGGGQPGPCGWLKDKFGLSWQVTPKELLELIRDPDPGRSQRAMKAMMGMTKIVIRQLRDAADGKA